MNQIGVQSNLGKTSKKQRGLGRGEAAAPHDVRRSHDSNRGATKSLQRIQKAGGVGGAAAP